MNSTVNFIGIGGSEKPSSRVLRQPGGGSSITFGDEKAQTPRAVKNHMQSNIFSTEKNGDRPRMQKNDSNSHTRLFGETNKQQPTPVRNHMKSSILPESSYNVANGQRDNVRNRNGSVSSASSSVSSSSENLKSNGISKTDGNSVTDHAINKTRVPPGGFSSALW